MILGLHHIAIIVSSEASVDFYKELGFKETYRVTRVNDAVVLLDGFGFELELFVDPDHPSRANNPENIGLRHFALRVSDIDEFAVRYGVAQINKDWQGEKYFYIKDPDGLPIEIHE